MDVCEVEKVWGFVVVMLLNEAGVAEEVFDVTGVVLDGDVGKDDVSGLIEVKILCVDDIPVVNAVAYVPVGVIIEPLALDTSDVTGIDVMDVSVDIMAVSLVLAELNFAVLVVEVNVSPVPVTMVLAAAEVADVTISEAGLTAETAVIVAVMAMELLAEASLLGEALVNEFDSLVAVGLTVLWRAVVISTLEVAGILLVKAWTVEMSAGV